MTKKAYVYVDSDLEYRVYPPVVVLEEHAGNPPVKDNFELVNLTDDDLIWGIGPGAFNQPNGGSVGGPLNGKGKAGSTSGPQAPNSKGAYSYAVVSPKSGKKAKGNSDPVIIIDI